MTRHIVHRILVSIPALIGVLLIGFLLLQVVPSDPAAISAGPDASEETIAEIRKDLGLDQPLLVQFGIYLSRVAQGDLGRSIISNASVAEELGNAIGPTIELLIMSMIWAIPLGIAMGTVAAVRRGTLVDRLIMAISVAGVSMPIFFVGLMLIQYVGFRMGLLPFTGREGPLWTWDGFISAILPGITLGSILVGPVARMTRTSVLEVLGADFVRTARAKGLKERVVIVHHALRNAMIPVITLIGLQAAYLLGGTVVTETLFAWPGVGRLAVEAIITSDFPIAQGAIIIIASAFLVMNLIVDLLYAYLDPRVMRS